MFAFSDINFSRKGAKPAKVTYSQRLLILMILALIGSITILSLVPPVSRDALIHHLTVPKLYLQHGGIYEIPSIVFSYYPMNLDLLYMIPLYFGNDIAPKFIHFTFALLTAWLIFSYLRKRIDLTWALFGALFFLSMPIIVKLSITVYVDLGLIFFSTASLMSLLKWIEDRRRSKFFIISAVCCGLALGTKYNGLIVLFILTLFIPFLYISQSKKEVKADDAKNKSILVKVQLKAVVWGTVFFAIALLVFSPWMIRNYVWKANPIYPLYNKVFSRQLSKAIDSQSGSQTHEPSADPQPASKAQSKPWHPFAIRKIIYGESWWEIALIPVRIFFQGQDDHPKYFDGKLNPFLFLLPFFAFIQLKNSPAELRTEKKIFMFYAVLFLLYAVTRTVIRIRYVAPIIPPLVILSTLGLHQLTRMVAYRGTAGLTRIGSAFFLIIGLIIFALNSSYILAQFRYVDPFSYISGRMTRDDYITKYRPEYSIYQYINRQLPQNVKILGLFLGNRRYYSDRELIFGINEFKKIVNQSNSEKILIKNLRQKGYTHLMIRYDLFNPWINKQFNESKKELLKLFFDGLTRPVLSKEGYGLFELRDR